MKRNRCITGLFAVALLFAVQAATASVTNVIVDTFDGDTLDPAVWTGVGNGGDTTVSDGEAHMAVSSVFTSSRAMMISTYNDVQPFTSNLTITVSNLTLGGTSGVVNSNAYNGFHIAIGEDDGGGGNNNNYYINYLDQALAFLFQKQTETGTYRLMVAQQPWTSTVYTLSAIPTDVTINISSTSWTINMSGATYAGSSTITGFFSNFSEAGLAALTGDSYLSIGAYNYQEVDTGSTADIGSVTVTKTAYEAPPSDLIDDFEGDSLDLNLWTPTSTGGGLHFVTNSTVTLTNALAGGSQRSMIISRDNDMQPFTNILEIAVSGLTLGGTSSNTSYNTFNVSLGDDTSGDGGGNDSSYVPNYMEACLGFQFEARSEDSTYRLVVMDKSPYAGAAYTLTAIPTDFTIIVDGSHPSNKTWTIEMTGAEYAGTNIISRPFVNFGAEQLTYDESYLVMGVFNRGTCITPSTAVIDSISVTKTVPPTPEPPVIVATVSDGAMILSWEGYEYDRFDVLTNSDLFVESGWGVLTNGVFSPYTNAINSDAEMFYKLIK